MHKKYSEKQVRELVTRLREEYDGVVRSQREAAQAIKEENKTLRARVSVLEGERGNVASAILHAEEAGERMKQDSKTEAENANKELKLLAEQCRLLLTRLNEKYPDEAEVKDFNDFCDALFEKLGMKEEESGFNLDDVLSPKQPLDLGKLCKELGVMGEDD